VPTIIAESPRLLIRRITPADVSALLTVYGDADAMQWVDDGQPLSRADAERWITVTLRNYETRGYGMFALMDRETGEMIGFAGLVHPGGQPEVELKYALRRDAWGRGLATEAATALLDYGLREHGIRHVIATTAPENEASHRVLRKAGMRRGATRDEKDGNSTLVFEWRPAPD